MFFLSPDTALIVFHWSWTGRNYKLQNLKCTQTDKENKFEWYIFAQTAPIPQWCALDQIRHCVTILCNTYYLNIYYLKCEYVPRWEQTM